MENRKLSPQAKGGLAKSKKIRDNYLLNPNLCLNCDIVIYNETELLSDIKSKKFCSHSCAAIFNNKKRIKKIKPVKISRQIDYENITKDFLFSSRKNWQCARSQIRKHAFYIYREHCKEESCICGYEKHLEICHIKPVSDFEGNATLSEINHPDNLVGLCPNCHWELDNFLIVVVKSPKV